MAKSKQMEYIPGHANHRRTEGDYLGVLLETVSLDDWRRVVSGALQAAQSGDPQARNWLAQYLMGRADNKAPSPFNVVVQQLNGTDPLVNKLASPYHSQNVLLSDVLGESQFDNAITEKVAAELAAKVKSG